MDQPLDQLPGEGARRRIMQQQMRKDCEECGDQAYYKLTFLLPNSRSNPASSAFLHDDCSWCEDACKFVCLQHVTSTEMQGYIHCSTIPASARFAKLFLYWQTTSDADNSTD
jgi:hypothetical protein